MTNELYELLSEVADNNKLQLIETTQGANGYPFRTSYALIGYESIDQIKKVKEEISDKFCEYADEEESATISSVYLHKRDGWHFWDVSDLPYIEEFDMEEYYEGKDYYSTFDKESYDDVETFMNDELMGELEYCDSFQSLKKIIEEKEELWNNITSLKDDEILVYNTDSKSGEVMKRKCLSFYYDTHHFAIGLTIE